MDETIGILVHGDNHFIVRGPKPDRETALSLARNWSVIQIGGVTPAELRPWRISTKEFRENLSWAVIVVEGQPQSPAVLQLLSELAASGVAMTEIIP